MFSSAGKILPWAALFALVAPAGSAQTSAVPCEATAEVKQALRALPSMSRPRLDALRALRERFPNDLFAHRHYQDIARLELRNEPEKLINDYRALAEKHPGDAMFRFLASRALVGNQTKEAIEHLEKQLRDTPAYPWPHMALVEIYRTPNFRDPQKFRRHLEDFMGACPNSVDAFVQARTVEDPEFARRTAERLRALFKDRTDPEAARVYGTLWTLEFRAAPASEHERVREQVTEDVKRLRAAAPANDREYLYALREGYTLLADAGNLKWVEEQIKSPAAAAPSMSAMAAYQQWREKNPQPKPDAPPEQRKTYNEAFLKVSADWIRLWPDDMVAWMNRMSALRQVENPPAADIIAAGEAYLRLYEKSGWTSLSPSLLVAEFYATKGVGQDRLPKLVEQGIKELDKPRPASRQSDLYPQQTPPGMPDAEYRLAQSQFYSWSTVARVWVQVKEKEKARDALVRMESLLSKLRPSNKADPEDAAEVSKQRTYAGSQSSYWQHMARLAELEDRKIDSLTFYQNALLARPPRPENLPAPAKDELAERARAVWKELGGTNEGWQAWFIRRAEIAGTAAISPAAAAPALLGRWTKSDKRMPEFEVTDVRGKTWSLEDFRGKTTFVNFWATW